jgi:hypothetical protein
MKKPTPEKSRLAPIVLPAQPWLERLPHKGCPIIVMTDHGRKVISILAAAGASQALISARLGMHLRTFKDLMARDETVRIAWESGIAEEEFLLVRHLRAQAENGAFVPGLWLLKTRHNSRARPRRAQRRTS